MLKYGSGEEEWALVKNLGGDDESSRLFVSGGGEGFFVKNLSGEEESSLISR
jgi:hypothetical protein